MEELGGIVILGIFAQWVAWRLKVPAILPLILIGLLVGPIYGYYHNEHKWIEPIFNQETNHGLFPGQLLFHFVSLSIGIILFEGGLTLKRNEISSVGPSIGRLITLGSLITFIGAGLAAHYIMQLDWQIAYLFAALIIVTGPTVIAPILQNVPLNRNIATVLKWEGILIDPIGALTAVLMFEFIVSTDGGMAFSGHALKEFFTIVCVGLSLGSLAALGLRYLLKQELIPHFLLNVFTLALVLAVYVGSDLLAHESGLLTVVVMGMVLGNLNVPNLHEILYFKESLSVLLISILFILLAANIDMTDLQLLVKDWRAFALFAVVVFILRPLSVFASTHESSLTTKEKIFISWVGPRGIVAAGIASLFGLRLMTAGGHEGAEYITPLVFMIVLGTVLLNATTAKPFAKLLGVIQDSSNGILIVGAQEASRLIGKYLQENGRHVVLIDNNGSNVEKARKEGLEAIESNIYKDALSEKFELTDVGYLLAMTGNTEVNNTAIRRFGHIFGEKGAYRLIDSSEQKLAPEALPENGIFSYFDDFINISDVAKDFPLIHEIAINSIEELEQLIGKMSKTLRIIPIFIKRPDGFLDILPMNLADADIKEGTQLVYMGKELELENTN